MPGEPTAVVAAEVQASVNGESFLYFVLPKCFYPIINIFGVHAPAFCWEGVSMAGQRYVNRGLWTVANDQEF